MEGRRFADREIQGIWNRDYPAEDTIASHPRDHDLAGPGVGDLEEGSAVVPVDLVFQVWRSRGGRLWEAVSLQGLTATS